jgi:hypothetical protein
MVVKKKKLFTHGKKRVVRNLQCQKEFFLMAPVSDVPYIAGQVMSIRTGHCVNKVVVIVCGISDIGTKSS